MVGFLLTSFVNWFLLNRLTKARIKYSGAVFNANGFKSSASETCGMAFFSITSRNKGASGSFNGTNTNGCVLFFWFSINSSPRKRSSTCFFGTTKVKKCRKVANGSLNKASTSVSSLSGFASLICFLSFLTNESGLVCPRKLCLFHIR